MTTSFTPTSRSSSRAQTVVVTARSFGSGDRDLRRELEDAGLVVVRGPATHDLTGLAPLLADAVAWIAGTGPVTEAHLALAPRLTVVARYGVGVDAVDLEAARRRGIAVTNTPGANSTAVADHAMALLLSVLRAIPWGDRNVRAGDWSVRRARELSTMTVGVVGFGRIGQLVAQRLRGFGSSIVVHDPYLTPKIIAGAGGVSVSMAELAARCHAVTLHAPGGQQVIDESWIGFAAHQPIVVNTARADLVDEVAVTDGLRRNMLSGYAADTLTSEGGQAGSPLLAQDLADRVVITPHTGAQTIEAVDRMGAAAVADVLAVLHGQPPRHPVL